MRQLEDYDKDMKDRMAELFAESFYKREISDFSSMIAHFPREDRNYIVAYWQLRETSPELAADIAREYLLRVNPESEIDSLKTQLRDLVEQNKFEEAANLKDKIDLLRKKHLNHHQ